MELGLNIIRFRLLPLHHGKEGFTPSFFRGGNKR